LELAHLGFIFEESSVKVKVKLISKNTVHR
jgi:hypothetical protein